MRKYFLILICLFACLENLAFANPFGGYKKQVKAENIETETANFNGTCNSADNTVQKCLDKLDDAVGGGSGETNTASNLGGGLANYDSKSGVDLRFNSFSGTDFDLASNLITIDSSIARDAEVATNIATHAALTEAHGSTGAVVGTTNTQTLTDKTLTLPKITSSAASTTETTVWNDSTQKTMAQYINGIKGFPEQVIFTQTADGGPDQTTNPTSLFGAGVGTLTLPANFFVAGKTVNIRIRGYMTTAGSSQGNFTVIAKLGSTTLGTTTAAALVAGANTFEWWIDYMITCRTTGASGTVIGQGSFNHNRSSATPVITPHVIGSGTFARSVTAAVTIDTTASQVIDITGTLTSGTTNRVISTNSYVEVIN